MLKIKPVLVTTIKYLDNCLLFNFCLPINMARVTHITGCADHDFLMISIVIHNYKDNCMYMI